MKCDITWSYVSRTLLSQTHSESYSMLNENLSVTLLFSIHNSSSCHCCITSDSGSVLHFAEHDIPFCTDSLKTVDSPYMTIVCRAHESLSIKGTGRYFNGALRRGMSLKLHIGSKIAIRKHNLAFVTNTYSPVMQSGKQVCHL